MLYPLMDKFIEEERVYYKKASYRWKKDLALHKLISFYLRPFNHRYMEGFTTTVYPHTDFPEKKTGDDNSMIRTEFHENMHKWRRYCDGFIWSLKYAYPQILAIPFLLAAAILGGAFGLSGLVAFLLLFHIGLFACNASRAEDGRPSGWSKAAFYVLTALGGAAAVGGAIYGGKWFAFFYLGAAVFVSPQPFKAFWRRDEEVLGYTVSLYYSWLRTNVVTDTTVDYYVRNFTGGNYFWMEPDGKKVKDEFMFQIARFQNNEEAFLANWGWKGKRGKAYPKMAEPFRMMRRFMEKEGLIHAERR